MSNYDINNENSQGAGKDKTGVMASYDNPRPAVLVATNRSGSTFLLHCLDSHPLIGCERGEPLSPIIGPWRNLRVKRHGLMRVLWSRPGYRVSMFKMSYKQVRWTGVDIIKEVKPAIIHLYRRNTLRVVVSSFINTAANRGEIVHPTHSFEPVERQTIWLKPEAVLSECRRYRRNTKAMTKKLRSLDLPALFLTYEELISRQDNDIRGLPTMAMEKLTDFLGVDPYPLVSYTCRINPWPLAQIVENWPEVVGVMRDTEFARNLELELETA